MIFKPYFGDYEIANIFRIGGPGLGNLLFPLCRSYIYSLTYDGELMPPIWPSLKIGALIRGEKEKRGYTNIFKTNFSTRILKQFNNQFNSQITEAEFLEQKPHEFKKKQTIRVEGLKNYFSDLTGYQEKLLIYLLSISSEHILNLYHSFKPNNIGVHIRLGDYSEEARTPISWYIDSIKEIQNHSSFNNTTFYIFSDGSDDELKEILNLPNCERISQPDAWGDILRLSKCRLIIGSNSTFSAWATFLGRKPFIRHEKFYLKKIHSDEKIYEGHTTEDFLLAYQN